MKIDEMKEIAEYRHGSEVGKFLSKRELEFFNLCDSKIDKLLKVAEAAKSLVDCPHAFDDKLCEHRYLLLKALNELEVGNG